MNTFVVRIVLTFSVGCGSSVAQSVAPRSTVKYEEIKFAAELLDRIDIAVNRHRALESSGTALLDAGPQMKCPAYPLAKFSMKTADIKRSTEWSAKATEQQQLARLEVMQLAAELIGRQDDSLKETDFNAGQPVGQFAEKLVRQEVVLESFIPPSYFTAEVELQRAIDECANEEFAKFQIAEEIKRNRRFLADVIRINALMSRVDLQPLVGAYRRHQDSVEAERARHPDAATARKRASEMLKRLETKELLASRTELVNAFQRAAGVKQKP